MTISAVRALGHIGIAQIGCGDMGVDAEGNDVRDRCDHCNNQERPDQEILPGPHRRNRTTEDRGSRVAGRCETAPWQCAPCRPARAPGRTGRKMDPQGVVEATSITSAK